MPSKILTPIHYTVAISLNFDISQMPRFLASEGKGADFIVLWLDCDKEGENICFEVLDIVEPVMSRGGRDQTVYRAHFSAITDSDIKAAFRNLGVPNKNEALAVDARQELDLRIGCAFTRFQTKFFQVIDLVGSHYFCCQLINQSIN